MKAGMKSQWIELEGKFVGISLGADFCAEHEWGIGELKHLMGMDGAKRMYDRGPTKYTQPHGVARRKITKHDAVQFYEHEGRAALICESRWWHESFASSIEKFGIVKAMQECLPHDLRHRDGLRTAWSEGDFGLAGSGADAAKIKELAAEFEKDNIAIWIGGKKLPAFENGGLIICIADRIPAKHLEMLRSSDAAVEELHGASEATGVIKRLDAAKKGYYACSPSWRNSGKKSAHPVMYWLNPTQQDENNFGWFTVEELDQWIAGTGPVPMKKAASQKPKKSNV